MAFQQSMITAAHLLGFHVEDIVEQLTLLGGQMEGLGRRCASDRGLESSAEGFDVVRRSQLLFSGAVVRALRRSILWVRRVRAWASSGGMGRPRKRRIKVGCGGLADRKSELLPQQFDSVTGEDSVCGEDGEGFHKSYLG
jgi:hypothetical protein